MIDILRAKKAFKEYVKEYDAQNGKVALKIAHIERVANVAKEIAEDLGLNQEDIELTQLIGLLHDIGRFEQIRRYNTFVDRDSINHGQFGADLLFKEGLIRKFIDSREYDSIIEKAIRNHNRSDIQEGLSDREILHAKIVRDADKTDIFYINTQETIENIYDDPNTEKEKITPIIMKEFLEDKKIDYSHIKGGADRVIAHLALLYDFNFDYGLKQIQDRGYMRKGMKRLHFTEEETQKNVEKAMQEIENYINQRLQIKDE